MTSPSSFSLPKMRSKVTPRNPSPNSVIRFDPLDTDQVRLLLRLSPGERIRVML